MLKSQFNEFRTFVDQDNRFFSEFRWLFCGLVMTLSMDVRSLPKCGFNKKKTPGWWNNRSLCHLIRFISRRPVPPYSLNAACLFDAIELLHHFVKSGFFVHTPFESPLPLFRPRSRVSRLFKYRARFSRLLSETSLTENFGRFFVAKRTWFNWVVTDLNIL